MVRFSVGCRQKAMEHYLDVFAQSDAEEEEEDGNSYVIPCFFRKSRMCWISSGLYGRVRVSLGYCQMLTSQIGLSGVLPTTLSKRLGTTSIRFASLKIVSVSWHQETVNKITANLHQAAVISSP
jgi:hypothetical protein